MSQTFLIKKVAIASGMTLGILSAVSLSVYAEGVPAGGDITVISGEPTSIYGARAACGDSNPPSFDRVMERVETMPEHGTLSDGGVGERYSNACQGEVPIRIIAYTSEDGYVGSDRLVVYGDTTNITVIVPAP